ncbi:serine protease 27-like [Antedon mediterranea]|uniref:serine protease 27-like n=1 Tax=Antedon mediterranea TaxID=105859 RepID=UPI003AF9E5B9
MVPLHTDLKPEPEYLLEAFKVTRTTCGCGGNVYLNTSDVVYISSPNYPDDHHNHHNCEWIVRSPQNTGILLTFSDLDLESCCDFLIITYVDFIGNTVTEYFTGQDNNNRVLAKTNINITFQTDYSVVNRGFELQLNVIDIDCPGHLCLSGNHIGVCLDSSLVCDGYDNCGDWTDEWHADCLETPNITCGERHLDTPRIIGGEDSDQGEWPWMVSLQYNNQHICGASVINEKWAVTAAHCINRNIDAYSIVAGERDINDGERDLNDGERIDVEEIIIYPYYNDYTSDSDIALILLATPLTFNDNIQPICYSDTKFEPGTQCYVAGWGVSGDGSLPSILQYTNVPLVDIEECRRNLSGSTVTDNMICAGHPEGGKDSCQGDSGGPLMCVNGSTWHLVGITSWGYGCAEPNFPGVYTRVSQFVDFINFILTFEIDDEDNWPYTSGKFPIYNIHRPFKHLYNSIFQQLMYSKPVVL